MKALKLSGAELLLYMRGGGDEKALSCPYYIEIPMVYFDDFIYIGFDDIEGAIKFGVKHTRGLYALNGQLNDMRVKIFKNGGEHVETVISGLPEAEYNRIKAERESKESGSVKAVTSFSWSSAPRR